MVLKSVQIGSPVAAKGVSLKPAANPRTRKATKCVESQGLLLRTNICILNCILVNPSNSHHVEVESILMILVTIDYNQCHR